MQETTKRVESATQLQLLGVPRYANGQPLPSRMGHKQLLLFTRLLLEKRRMTRESILAFLWPESDEARARGSLRQALYVMREVVGNDALTTDRQTIALTSSLPTDLTNFIRAVHAGQWLDAVRLYRGPLLDGVQVKDATDADLWLELERRRMARLFETAAVAVLRGSSGVSDAQERVLIARKLRDSAPGSVMHWRYLFEELVKSGACDERRIECAALGARIDTGQIDDIDAATALLKAVPDALSTVNAWNAADSSTQLGRQ